MSGWFSVGAPGLKLAAGIAALLATASLGSIGAARAQAAPVRHATHARHTHMAGARSLTVHARHHRAPRSFYADDSVYVEGPLHRWDDPRLYEFGPFRLGGENFYGDDRGEPITRGNASLGMIAGYGGARGGYGGPHFDSVGGFHNGPGPEAQEADDYATGSIWRPDYGGVVPHYPSIKAQLASLNTGIVAPTERRSGSASLRWPAAERTGPATRAGSDARSGTDAE